MEKVVKSPFRNPVHQARFEQDGYVIFDMLSEIQLSELRRHVENTPLPDTKGYGFNVAMDNESYALRQEIHNFLVDFMRPLSSEILINREPYSTSYMIKEPNSGLVPAHQDWSYTREEHHASIMCWVALDDVDIENGAMAFIPGSHQLFDYKRVFPFPYAKTPVERFKLELMPYLKIEPMKAGQVVFFNNKTIHGSFPNTHPKRRYAFCMSFSVTDEPILHFQFSNPHNLNQITEYEVENDFFVVHNNETLTNTLLLHHGNLKEGTLKKSEPYYLPELNWETLERMLSERGINHSEPLQERLTKFLNKQS
ncbi:phytanoyl-CoA dioxygenase family protein [Marinoscillum sp.]|uniref:phytanoyl-CoA dioxygenase family protein n=1 Tax=Marinoscillum sp. TaxID=2024838 RepID=UPI003BAAF5DD